MSCNDLEKSLAFWYSGFQNLRVDIAGSFSNTLVKGGRSKLVISIYRVLVKEYTSEDAIDRYYRVKYRNVLCLSRHLNI